MVARLTQTELSRRTGVPQPDISAAERGRKPVSDAYVERLVRACYQTELNPTPAVFLNMERFRAIAALTVLDPERVRAHMTGQLQRMREWYPGQLEYWLGRWEALLEKWDTVEMIRLFLSEDPDDVELRKVAPTAGLLSEEELAAAGERARRRWREARAA